MSATVPTSHPFPFSNGGGLAHANATRPLRGRESAYVRQPDLKFPPAVMGATGFGSGGGAMILNNGSDADQSQGMVAIRVGVAPAASGSIILNFELPPSAGQYVAFADWASLILTPAGNAIEIDWTATRALIPGELVLLAYQWAVSQ